MCALIRSFFRPRQNNFLRLLEQQAGKTVEGLEALSRYMEAQDDVTAQEVERAEREADELRRILIDELNRTFITPIDREDIFSLSRAIDDIVDYAYSTVDEMQILDVESNEHLQQMVSLLHEAGQEILLAMQRLEEHPRVANDHAMRAKALENRVESVYREGIAWLFKQPSDLEHIIQMLKLREIFRHLSNAADRGDEAANIISDIIVKMT